MKYVRNTPATVVEQPASFQASAIPMLTLPTFMSMLGYPMLTLHSQS
jgi:hypothetical protein